MKITGFLLLFFCTIQGISQSVYIPDDNFEEELIDLGYDDVLDDSVLLSSIDTVTYLDVDSKYINSLVGIEAFTALITLKCESNSLTTLDVSSNLNLKNLYCKLTQLTELDVTNNLDLEVLYFGYNSVSTIDLSNNLNLRRLDCQWNSIELLDVTVNTELRRIIMYHNDIESINLSTLPLLDYLDCRSNELTELDCSNNPDLEILNCARNDIVDFDIASCPSLSYLDCSYNSFTAIDLTENVNLEVMDCSGSELIHLDLDNNTNLQYVKLRNGVLETLTVKNGNNTEMEYWTNVDLRFNPYLACVTVDDQVFSTDVWTEVDEDLVFSNDCASLNVAENTDFELSVYPNPTSEILNISSNLNNFEVRFYAISGEVLLFEKSTSGNQSIDVSSLSQGVYLVELIGEGKVFKEQIVVW
ncbi:MAG: T9SS type A sorting domain-containing protein [Crocinitomix sp.]|nr:T9SS type A sorting domain-containing protein [Crocinitomix sp.]